MKKNTLNEKRTNKTDVITLMSIITGIVLLAVILYKFQTSMFDVRSKAAESYCVLIKSTLKKEKWNCYLPPGWSVSCVTSGNPQSIKYLSSPIRNLNVWTKISDVKYKFVVSTGQVPPSKKAMRECYAIKE